MITVIAKCTGLIRVEARLAKSAAQACRICRARLKLGSSVHAATSTEHRHCDKDTPAKAYHCYADVADTISKPLPIG